MAKTSSAGAFGQHVEKGVLGVSVMLLLYGLVSWWGTGSTLEPFPGAKASTDIDPLLKRQTEQIRSSWDSAAVPAYQKPLDVRVMSNFVAAATDQPVSAGLLTLVEIGQARLATSAPEGTGPRELFDLAKLMQNVPAPARPKIRARRVLPEVQELHDEIHAYGVTSYPAAELTRVWTDRLKRFVPRVTVVKVELEVQQQLINGQWGTPKAVPLPPPVRSLNGQQVSIPAIKPFGGQNRDEALTSTVELALDDVQTCILMPEYGRVYWPATKEWVPWIAHLPELQSIIVRAQPEVEPTPTPTPTPRPTPAARPTPMRPVVRPSTPRGAPRGMDLPPDPMNDRMAPYGMGMPGDPDPGMFPDMLPGMPGSPASPMPGRPVNPVGAGPSLPGIAPYAQQKMSGELAIWFRDASLLSGQAYRYRLRLVLVNPLYTLVSEVNDPQDANRTTVTTPWSDWSGPVAVPSVTEFFLDGAAEFNAQAQVSIFTQALGQTVRQQAKVQQGNVIGGEQSLEVPNPREPGQKVPQKVDFATGCVVIGLDFNKTFFRNGMNRRTVELLYVDPDGQLKARYMEADRESPRYKDLMKRLEK